MSMTGILRFLLWTEQHRWQTVGLLICANAFIVFFAGLSALSSTLGWIFFLAVFTGLMLYAQKRRSGSKV